MNIVPMIRDANKILAAATAAIFSVMFLVVLSVWSSHASAAEQTLVCKQYGHTDKAEDFHSIKTLPLTSTFKLEGTNVVFGDVTFKSVDPSMVGLEGLAITYYLANEEKILYFYMNDEGNREVGISHVEEDSDTIFGDKSLFTDCNFDNTPPQKVVGNVTRANLRKAVAPSAYYTF